MYASFYRKRQSGRIPNRTEERTSALYMWSLSIVRILCCNTVEGVMQSLLTAVWWFLLIGCGIVCWLAGCCDDSWLVERCRLRVHVDEVRACSGALKEGECRGKKNMTISSLQHSFKHSSNCFLTCGAFAICALFNLSNLKPNGTRICMKEAKGNRRAAALSELGRRFPQHTSRSGWRHCLGRHLQPAAPPWNLRPAAGGWAPPRESASSCTPNTAAALTNTHRRTQKNNNIV